MRFLLEDINTLSKEAKKFLETNQSFSSKVEAFEKEFNVNNSLKTSKDLIDFLTENVYLSDYEREEDDGYVSCDSWGDPIVDNIYYSSDNSNNLWLTAEIHYDGDGIAVSGWVDDDWYELPYYKHENDITITASLYLEVKIPDSIEDYDKYEFYGEDNIEYEEW